MKLFLASDHAGFELKNILAAYLQGKGNDVKDLGPRTLVLEDDYTDLIMPLAHMVADDPETRGIVLGKSGQGEAMAANRVKGARAAVYYGPTAAAGKGDEILTLSREHNDANILSIGAGFVSAEEAKHAADLWLATPFSGEARHVRRIAKLDHD